MDKKHTQKKKNEDSIFPAKGLIIKTRAEGGSSKWASTASARLLSKLKCNDICYNIQRLGEYAVSNQSTSPKYKVRVNFVSTASAHRMSSIVYWCTKPLNCRTKLSTRSNFRLRSVRHLLTGLVES